MNYFNELFDSNKKLRAPYQHFYEHWNSFSKEQKQKLYARSKDLFSGDYKQDPLPRVLTQPEFLTLQQGVYQRAEAIICFLHDFYSRGQKWKHVISPWLLQSILQRNHSKSLLGKLNPQAIAFPYGPDIIRNQKGEWNIVEDSAGMVGGIGDLISGQKILRRLVPAFRPLLKNSNDPKIFFGQLAKYFRLTAQRKNGIPLLYLEPTGASEDHESDRLAEAFAEQNIEVVINQNPGKRLIVEQNGIFFQRGRKKLRVGYLITHAGPESVGHYHFHLFLKALRIEKNETIKTQIISKFFDNIRDHSRLQKVLLSGRTRTNFSPGVQFVNDKMFGLFVDSLIEHYLKAAPILRSIPAKPLASITHKSFRLDARLLDSVRRKKDEFVLKQVDRDGGGGVWIGHKLSKKDFNFMVDFAKRRPEKYIVQKFEHLSVLENRIVDLRIHAHVAPENIIVSNLPWGRANWLYGSGKVNIGAKGFVSPIVV